MPRRKENALGKPQGVKKKKVQPITETPQYKAVVVPLSIGSRLDADTVRRLAEVYG